MDCFHFVVQQIEAWRGYVACLTLAHLISGGAGIQAQDPLFSLLCRISFSPQAPVVAVSLHLEVSRLFSQVMWLCIPTSRSLS